MRPGELDRFVDEHLTAASVMVPIAEPLPARMPVRDAKALLEQNEFDLALVEDDRLQVVQLVRLNALDDADLDEPVLGFSEAPRGDRLIDASLPIRQVVGLLMARRDPLLVVGESGIRQIVTVSDFAGVAGTAVVLAFLLALDRAMNELLLTRPDEAVATLGPTQREEAERRRAKAAEAGVDLPLINYVTMGARFTALRRLHRGLNLGTKEEHLLLRDIRNESAHNGLSDPYLGLRAIALSEWMLASLSALPVPGADGAPVEDPVAG